MLNKNREINVLRWSLILLFLVIVVVSCFLTAGKLKDFAPIATVLCLFTLVILHGSGRYGFKNILIFFCITFVVSNFFEALSIRTGFPFGHYFYDKLIGPRLFDVPLIIMPAYFGMGYASWTLAHILLNQFQTQLYGKQVFLIPFIAAFVMVMWDVCMDPSSSTVDSLWVWKEGGAYFGVPLQNYFGWFLVVYIIYQLFALYLARINIQKIQPFAKMFWLEMIAVYFIQALSQLLVAFTQMENFNIHGPMAMVTVFTMMFVALLSSIKVIC